MFVTALCLHPTDRKILDAFDSLSAQPGRVTDRRLAHAAGLAIKRVKKRRQRLAGRGLWPGRPLGRSTVRLAAELEQHILARAVEVPRPTYEVIAQSVACRFGRQIDPKAVGNVINRPAMRWLSDVQRRIQAEALREFRTRHNPVPYRAEPAWQILRRFSSAQGRVLGLTQSADEQTESDDELAGVIDRAMSVASPESADRGVPTNSACQDHLPFASKHDLLSTGGSGFCLSLHAPGEWLLDSDEDLDAGHLEQERGVGPMPLRPGHGAPA